MCMPSSTYLRKCHHSANPVVIIYRHQKVDVIDIIFLDMPAADDGEKASQLFVSHNNKLVSIHPMKGTDKQNILGVFQDHVR